jgi:hypothetical protein
MDGLGKMWVDWVICNNKICFMNKVIATWPSQSRRVRETNLTLRQWQAMKFTHAVFSSAINTEANL